MVFARPKMPLKDTGGSGIVLNIEWFKDDPGDDRDILPDFHGQALIPAPSVDAVTVEMIEDAIAAQLPMAEAELMPSPEPKTATRAMLGKVFDAGRISAVARQRREAKGGRS